MLENLGNHIRDLRKKRSLTLVEIAEKTGIAQATLSRIETGTMIGTVESHQKIADAIGIGLGELYLGLDPRKTEVAHQKSGTERTKTLHSRNVQIELLTQQTAAKKMTPLLITLGGKAKTEKETRPRGCEKFLWVQSGSVDVELEGEKIQLKTDDTLYFDASLPHRLSNAHEKTAKIFSAVSSASS